MHEWRGSTIQELRIKSSVFIVIALAFIWVILSGSFSLLTIAIGIAISISCLYVYKKFIPASEEHDVSYFKLALFPLFLARQIYLSAFVVIKIILTGAKVDVIEVDTKLESEFLRLILSVSVTLTPGSILLELKDRKLVILRLRGINEVDADVENVKDLIKEKLEKRLLKAQR